MGRKMKPEKHFKRGGFNTILNFVPHQEAWVVERMGKFHRILEPGLNMLIPIIDKIKYVHCLKEMTFVIPQQEAITMDNVQLDLDAVLYVRVVNPYNASYGVQNPEFAITQLAQTVMRSEVGKLQLDTVFRERASLNLAIVEGIKESAAPWGMVCLRYEIRSMTMPPEIQRAMKMQVEAERKKRAIILESEGARQAQMNQAEGEKQSRILRSEAEMQEQVNKASAKARAAESDKQSRILMSEAEMQQVLNAAIAQAKAAESTKQARILAAEGEMEAQVQKALGSARAIELEASAHRQALEALSAVLSQNGGSIAASYTTAENYVKAFAHLAKNTNTVIVPANPTDVSGMVAQAMSIYSQLSVAAPK